jgi:hypothetical protein
VLKEEVLDWLKSMRRSSKTLLGVLLAQSVLAQAGTQCQKALPASKPHFRLASCQSMAQVTRLRASWRMYSPKLVKSIAWSRSSRTRRKMTWYCLDEQTSVISSNRMTILSQELVPLLSLLQRQIRPSRNLRQPRQALNPLVPIEDGNSPQIQALLLGASHRTKNKLLKGVPLGLST